MCIAVNGIGVQGKRGGFRRQGDLALLQIRYSNAKRASTSSSLVAQLVAMRMMV